ncbi:unnamed protein product [Linum tenue]|uniref:Secreted protein n=1 Tax=Linum tenue TaxID=586396 RepID=A0AAV0M667_9ROSI|nr:unnamed protein product [Linum tenue]
MKGSCTLVASMIAASTVALSSSSSAPPNSAGDREVVAVHPTVNQGSRLSSAREQEQEEKQGKFVPRFDGLRFIETLVTAHR